MENTAQELVNTGGQTIGVGGIILIIASAITAFVITVYNRLTKLRIVVENAFSDIDVSLKKRFDLVDNLVSTVKGLAEHEKETLTKVISARNMYANATTDNEKVQADSMLTGTLKTLFAVSEAYPDIKADAGFINLQNELSALESNIARKREYYNATIREYAQAKEVFPSNLVAGLFSFEHKEYFTLGDVQEREAPKVSF